MGIYRSLAIVLRGLPKGSIWLMGVLTLVLSLVALLDVAFVLYTLKIVWQTSVDAGSPKSFEILIAAALVLGRGLASVYVKFLLDKELGRVSVQVVQEMLRAELAAGRESILSRTSSDSTYVYTTGAHTALMHFLGAVSIWVAESVGMIATFVAMLLINPVATLAFGLVVLISLLVIRGAINTRLEQFGRMFQELHLRRMNLVESLSKIRREIRTSDSASHFLGEQTVLHQRQVRLARNLSVLTSLPRLVLDTAFLMVVVIIAIGLTLIDRDEQLLSALVLLGASAFRLMPTATAVATSLGVIRRALGESQPFLQVAQRRHWKIDRLGVDFDFRCEKRYGLVDGNEVVRCSEVGFATLNKSQVLRSFDLVVARGDRVLIYGDSGTGKSTLFDLLIGELLPQQGSITVFGLPPAEAIARYPRKIGAVPQNPQLIKGDLLFNVTLSPDQNIMDRARVTQVLSQVGLQEPKFSLSRQILDNEFGSTLSGGEIQRISIARVLYQKPDLVILDEPTSALDPYNRELVIRAINELGATVIVISHEFEYLEWASKVVRVTAVDANSSSQLPIIEEKA